MQQSILFILFVSLSLHCSAQSNGLLEVSEHQLENGDATGMAHYLEHMLFKGTQTLGTSNYEAEKVHLDSIRLLYNQLGQIKEEDKRLAIQKAIDQQSIKASKYGLPTEFVKLLKSIGSRDINAFTSYDMTCYLNEFPPNQIEKWLDIYATRFQQPVLRSFQSELEIVYEEKNRSADQFTSKIFREVNQLLFPKLPLWTMGNNWENRSSQKPTTPKKSMIFSTNIMSPIT